MLRASFCAPVRNAAATQFRSMPTGIAFSRHGPSGRGPIFPHSEPIGGRINDSPHRGAFPRVVISITGDALRREATRLSSRWIVDRESFARCTDKPRAAANGDGLPDRAKSDARCQDRRLKPVLGLR